MKFYTALLVGLATVLGIANADVSHLSRNQQAGHNTYVANDGRVVKQSFNANGNAAFSAQNGSPRDVNNYFAQQQSSRFSQQSAPCTDSNSACVAPQFCFNGVIDQLVENKASRSTNGRCNTQDVCCKFAQRRSANFKVIALDSVASPAQSTSEVLTNEGYVVRKPSNKYLPSFDDQPTNEDPVFLKPTPQPATRPPPPPITTRRPQTPPPQPPRPTNLPRPIEPAPIVIPIGCSAALNCTRIEMCSAIGVISKTPVILTPEQQLFRVPLSECLHPQTKEQGVCCRDPDYTDPWPVGRTGQYVPDELNSVFDSGAYKPETTNVDIVRVKPPTEGYVIPQPSNNQNRLYLPPRNQI
ncbi:hypothetical protein ACKWTF_005172 [Chironomus riparius]